MSLIYNKKFIEDKLATLAGYTQVSLTKVDLLNKLAKVLVDNDIEFTEELEDAMNSSSDNIEAVISENAYTVLDVEIDSLFTIDYTDAGDGNPCETLMALLDKESKTYSLFAIQGYYSSWDSNSYESVNPVKLQIAEYYETVE